MVDRSQFRRRSTFAARPKQAEIIENTYEIGPVYIAIQIFSRHIQRSTSRLRYFYAGWCGFALSYS